MNKETTNDRKIKIYGIPFALGISALLFFLLPKNKQTETLSLSTLNIPCPQNEYGVRETDYDVLHDTIRRGDIFSGLLTKYDVPYGKAIESVHASKDIINVSYGLIANKPIKFLKNKQTEQVEAMIYEPSALNYIVFHLNDSVYTELVNRPVDTVVRTASGVIESSLWNAIVANNLGENLSANLGIMMEDAFAYTISLHHLAKGDNFKLVYEELYVEGELVALGRLKSALFDHKDKEYYAVRYKSSKYDGYFDLEGRTMKRGFLKAPVEYTRISSRYSPKRFHPVLKRYKSHLGTDFAAPAGTPIRATRAGTITKRSYTKGNGNYVKVKHNDTYTTQYLHMSKFARGQKVGSHVKQGEVIGYVGQTGYATGPHVCYRFWKNGKQVDPIRLNFPDPKPMPAEELPAYFVVRDAQMDILGQIELKIHEVPSNIMDEQTENVEPLLAD